MHDLYSRLGGLDETDVKSKLSKKLEDDVRAEFPQHRLWYAGKDAAAQETDPAIPADPATTLRNPRPAQ